MNVGNITNIKSPIIIIKMVHTPCFVFGFSFFLFFMILAEKYAKIFSKHNECFFIFASESFALN